ncbi:MAG: IclR family transcriptional regulator [Pyramidobacter sp.]|jgi:IclR family KDG regulon transcriptional repressor
MNAAQAKAKNDAVGKTVRIMETLVRADHVLSVREIAAETGIPHSTVHRFLLALEKRGWAAQDAGTGNFRAGLRFFLLNRSASFFSELVRCARAPMKKLVEQTGKTAILSVIEGSGGLCIHTEEPPQAVKFVAREGMAVPLDRGATGLVLLAWCSAALRARVIAECAAAASGGNGLIRRVEKIRSQGYSHSSEEWMPHAEDLSVPVFDRSGVFAAQLGIAGLAGTFGSWESDLLPALRAASGKISSSL